MACAWSWKYCHTNISSTKILQTKLTWSPSILVQPIHSLVVHSLSLVWIVVMFFSTTLVCSSCMAATPLLRLTRSWRWCRSTTLTLDSGSGWLRHASLLMLTYVELSHSNCSIIWWYFLVVFFFCLFILQQSGQPQKGDHTKSDTVQTVFGSGLHRKLTAAPIQPRAKKTGWAREQSYRIAEKFGGLYYNRQIKIRQNFLLTYMSMAIPYRTAKFKFTNILAKQYWAQPPNLISANISGYTVHQVRLSLPLSLSVSPELTATLRVQPCLPRLWSSLPFVSAVLSSSFLISHMTVEPRPLVRLYQAPPSQEMISSISGNKQSEIVDLQLTNQIPDLFYPTIPYTIPTLP